MAAVTAAEDVREVGNVLASRTAALAWLAGLLEGEGWFGTTTSIGGHRYPRIVMAMTDKDIVDRACAVAGVGRVRMRSPQEAHHKPSWALEVTRQADAAGLMMTLYPFLGERRQAKIRETLAIWRATPIRRQVRRV